MCSTLINTEANPLLFFHHNLLFTHVSSATQEVLVPAEK